MKIRSITGLVLLPITVAGCVPMEQATLTYTSKSTIGVGVEAGTQQTPGLDVTIGFKETNIALVPVAVAKYCYKATSSQCQNAIYRMELVRGGKNDSSQTQPIVARINDINRTLEELNGEQSRQTQRLADLRANIAVAEAAESARAELAELNSTPPDESAERANRLAELQAKANSAPANFSLSEARAQAAAIEADQTARSTRIKTFQEDKVRLTAQLEADTESGRTDALSVYGRFNGTANGDEGGAGLTAGKVFATGIAAQNLTEFATTAECLSNIGALASMIDDANAAERDKLLSSAPQICSRQSAN